MIKSKNVGGDNIFVITVQMPVASRHFIHRWAIYRHNGGESIKNKRKKEVMEIIQKELVYYGISNEVTEKWDAASEEFWEKYLEGEKEANEWLMKNYPYLLSKKKEEEA
jgi:hypothetical protein